MSASLAPVPAIGQRWPIRVIPAKSQTRNASNHPVLLKISRDRPTLAYHLRPVNTFLNYRSLFRSAGRSAHAPLPPLRQAAQAVPAAPVDHPPPRPNTQTNFIHLPNPPPPPTLVTRKPVFPRQMTTSTYRTFNDPENMNFYGEISTATATEENYGKKSVLCREK